jgi:predicted metal-dependent phosphoesterase TrpH
VLSAELHAHSSASYDGRDGIERLLERAAEVGLDALAVTDHDTFAASEAAAERAPEYGLVGIRGIEVSSAAGHVLGLGVSERIEPDRSFADTIDRIHDAGGIAVVPHPFQEMRSGVIDKISREELLAADAIEVYNSRLITGRSNWQARRFATKHGMPMTAGSDAHVSDMSARAVTAVDATDRTETAICEAIRAGRTTLQTRRTPWLISFRQAVGNTRLRVKSYVDNLLG